jgi:hypothetical protein
MCAGLRRAPLSTHRDFSRTSGDDVDIHRRNILRIAAAGAVAVGALFAAGSASAAMSWSIGVNIPGVVVSEPAPVYYEPAPVYSPPAPVYYQPPPVRYRPPAVYEPAPVYYEPGPRWGHEERREWRRREWEHREHYRRYHEDRD